MSESERVYIADTYDGHKFFIISVCFWYSKVLKISEALNVVKSWKK